MVEQDRDIKDICHVVSLCINIKEAEGREKKREERRREGETIDSIGGDRSQEDRAIARQAGKEKEVFEIGHLTAFSSRMMPPSLSSATAPRRTVPSSPSPHRQRSSLFLSVDACSNLFVHHKSGVAGAHDMIACEDRC